MNFRNKDIHILMDIGLSKLQAKVYMCLLQKNRSTGYQVAKQLNEPIANTYKALDALQKQGLILLDDSKKIKYYTAQPISHYLDQLELQFTNKRKVIENVIKPIQSEPVQEGIYRIESYEQFSTLSSALIEKSHEIIAVDSSPLPIEIIKKNLQKASKRGITVLIKSCKEIPIPGCEVVFSGAMESLIYKLPIQFFLIIVPEEGYITAMLDHENKKLLYGVYIKNKFLSILAYNGFIAEFFGTKAVDMLNEGRSGQEVLEEWKRIYPLLPLNTNAWNEFIKSVTAEINQTDN